MKENQPEETIFEDDLKLSEKGSNQLGKGKPRDEKNDDQKQVKQIQEIKIMHQRKNLNRSSQWNDI